MGRDRETIDGYVADSLYPSAFHAALAPPRIDAMVRHRGFTAPRAPRGPFTLVDLGCGDGIGLIVNAVAHPEAFFIGLDASPGHIARGSALVAELGLKNVILHCAMFQQGLSLIEASCADYVTSQGVLAWVSAEARTALMSLADHALRPGGALTLGYNCNPGWLQIAPLQRLLMTFGNEADGTPSERFDAALAAVRLSGAVEPTVLEWIDNVVNKMPGDYLAHEYLNQCWQPLWASDVIGPLAGKGFAFIGDAGAWRLREDFSLKADWRRLLAQIEDVAQFQSALDVVTRNWFRTDIYLKSPVGKLDPETAVANRLSAFWAARTSMEDARFEAATTAGTIRFDNAAARAIMARLQTGPAPLSAVSGIGAADLLNSADALFLADQIVPVEPPATPPHARNASAALEALAQQGSAMNALIGNHGAIEVACGKSAERDAGFCTRMGIAL